MSFTKPSEKWPRTSLSYSEGPLHIPSPCKTEDNNTRPRTPEFPPFNLVSGWSHLVRCCYLLGVCACPNFSRETETERNLSFFLSLFLPSSFFISVYLNGVYHEELAHKVMEAEKTHDLLSASWRPRQVGGVIQLESEGLRSRGAEDINLSPGT